MLRDMTLSTRVTEDEGTVPRPQRPLLQLCFAMISWLACLSSASASVRNSSIDTHYLFSVSRSSAGVARRNTLRVLAAR